MDDIAVIDIIVPPPSVIEIVTGEKGDPGPPGPPGADGEALPTAPIGQVLSSQGPTTAPVFRPEVFLLNPASTLVNQRAWRVSVQTGGDLWIQLCDDAGQPQGAHVGIDPYNGGFYTVYGGFGALNGGVEAKWLTPDVHTLADLMGSAARNTVGNLVTVSDSTTNTPGAVVAGGGAFNVLARWNGTNFIVISG